jgi:signal transduction histidine kinase
MPNVTVGRPTARLLKATLATRWGGLVGPLWLGDFFSVALIIFIVVVALSTAHAPVRPMWASLMAFYAVTGIALGAVDVRMEFGRVSLNALACLPAAVLLPPFAAAIVALAASTLSNPPATPRIWLRRVGGTLSYTTLGAVVGSYGYGAHIDLPILAPVVIVVVALLNVVIVSTMFSIDTPSRSVRDVVARTVTRLFLLYYTYLFVASLLTISVVDGTFAGYLRAVAVFVLSYALLEGVAGRISRSAFKEQMAAADERVSFGRAVEEVLHQLKHYLATALGYLEESEQADPEQRLENVAIAVDALRDAADLMAATARAGRVINSPHYATHNLGAIAKNAADLLRPPAQSHHIRLREESLGVDTPAFVDRTLIREIVTNLMQNSIEAMPNGGVITVRAGTRADGWGFITVIDTGPGVPSDLVDRLFKERVSTKGEKGSGLGLLTSQSVARQHYGKLVYGGGKRGAVFTILLPPEPLAREKLSRPPVAAIAAATP